LERHHSVFPAKPAGGRFAVESASNATRLAHME
jgi:hypothetical protein